MPATPDAAPRPPPRLATPKRTTLGVCAMAKKTQSKPMREILSRLPGDAFEIVIFEESVILEAAVEAWPVVECLIAFHSSGFPLDKAIQYAKLRKPFVVNDLRRQHLLRDRRLVYATLARAGVPTPRHVCVNRDRDVEQKIEELDDAIIIDGVKIEKPFVEKPVDSDDHNIRVYYPTSAGGGCKRLFRKVGNQSSKYEPDLHSIRREGSYLYEEFVDTQGTDVKVYSVGPYYGHAEARKSPTLDGVVLRGADGKELRYPVILSWVEKDVAFKIYHAFRQTVCGFDILRTHDGACLVCDVNGWSFVKKSRKYYDDCAALLAAILRGRDGRIVDMRPPPRELPPSPPKICSRPQSPSGLAPSRRELRCVIAVVRHGDRTPKRKLKVKTTHPSIVQIHRDRCKTPKKEVKLKESKDLRAFSSTLKAILLKDDIDAFRKIREVLKSHKLDDEEELLGGVFFSGCKLQLKPLKWEDDETTEVQVVLKWGGVLTELGAQHATALGAHFRRHMYPTTGGQGLLRLHATFRHDLKIRTSDEGRVMKTGAAFTKGLLELEGEISPILVSLIHRGRSDVHMLDRAGNHEAQELLALSKAHVSRCFQVDVELRGPDSDDEDAASSDSKFAQRRRFIAPDGPDSVLRALRDLGNPLRALRDLYDEMSSFIEKVSQKPCTEQLYMGESFGVWLDSWKCIRKEFYDQKAYDLSKIPEIFDKLRFDARHNALTLSFDAGFGVLVKKASTLSQAVAPLEFGSAAEPRRQAAWHVSRALLDKISFDLRTARGDTEDSGLHFQLDDHPEHLADSEIKSHWRAVRSRLYFTSESHLHALLDALRLNEHGTESVVDDAGRRWLSAVPELSYLSHVVFRLWEDTSYDTNAEGRYSVEVQVSPGTPFVPLETSDEAPPTLPLHSFARVSSAALERYLGGKHDVNSEENVAKARVLYEGLADSLEACAGGGVLRGGARLKV